MRSPSKLARIALIVAPLVALGVVPIFISGTSPRIFGMPPIMWWTVLWLALTPVCLFSFGRLRER